MKLFGYEIKKIRKRQASSYSDFFFTGPGQAYSYNRASNLASVFRCLKIFSDILIYCPLKTRNKKHHPLLDLFKQPCSFLTRNAYLQIITEQVLLYGCFRAHIQYTNRGRITSLIPYKWPQIFAYPRFGDFQSGQEIEKYGYFFKDYRGKTLLPSEIFSVVDNFYGQDFLNPLSRVAKFSDVFKQSNSVLEFSKSLSASGGMPASLMTGLSEDDSDAVKDARNATEAFTKLGEQTAGKILTLPSGFALKSMMQESPGPVLQYLSSFSDLQISRLFGVPLQMLSDRSDAKSSSTASSVKETNRFFLKQVMQPFLKNISDSISTLTSDSVEFYFDMNRLRASDLREQGTFLRSAIDAKIMTKEECREWLGMGD